MRLTSDHAPCPLLLKAYVPESHLPNFDVAITSGKAPAFEKANGWRFTHTESTFPQDGYHLLGALAREHALKHGLYSTHSACIDGHLLVGHSGAGKTSVLLELMALGMQNLMATNKTLLDANLVAYGGTRSITLEAADAPKGLDSKAYGSRVAFMPKDDVYAKGPQPLKAIWFIKLNDKPAEVLELSALSASHRLYPFMMDRVNADVLLAGGEVLFKADDSDAAAALACKLPQALAAVPVHQISGSRKAIAQFIHAQFIKESS